MINSNKVMIFEDLIEFLFYVRVEQYDAGCGNILISFYKRSGRLFNNIKVGNYCTYTGKYFVYIKEGSVYV